MSGLEWVAECSEKYFEEREVAAEHSADRSERLGSPDGALRNERSGADEAHGALGDVLGAARVRRGGYSPKGRPARVGIKILIPTSTGAVDMGIEYMFWQIASADQSKRCGDL
jgi:hypothetical protein